MWLLEIFKLYMQLTFAADLFLLDSTGLSFSSLNEFMNSPVIELYPCVKHCSENTVVNKIGNAPALMECAFQKEEMNRKTKYILLNNLWNNKVIIITRQPSTTIKIWDNRLRQYVEENVQFQRYLP